MNAGTGNRPLCTDARMLGDRGTGVASYARTLRQAQLRLDPAAKLLSGPPSDGPAARARRAGRALLPIGMTAVFDARGYTAPDLFRLAHVHFTIHRRLLPVSVPGTPGLIHWSYPVPLRLVGWCNIYTLHDAIPLLRPDLTPIDPVRHRRVLRRIVAAADRIVTVSQAARADIVAALGCDPGQVIDCSQPVDVESRIPAALPPGLTPGGYLLFCGQVEPRKNIARLLAAYRSSGTHLPLVLAGPEGWRADTLTALLVATPGVRRIAFCERAVMLRLIADARALLLPSLAEGFGLPIAEAMALGTPVLTAASGAPAETAGGAALLVDPEDPAAMARGIASLANDSELRAALSARGRIVARRFSAEHFTERLARLYTEIFAATRPLT